MLTQRSRATAKCCSGMGRKGAPASGLGWHTCHFSPAFIWLGYPGATAVGMPCGTDCADALQSVAVSGCLVISYLLVVLYGTASCAVVGRSVRRKCKQPRCHFELFVAILVL
jgi:hypothetical protein